MHHRYGCTNLSCSAPGLASEANTVCTPSKHIEGLWHQAPLMTCDKEWGGDGEREGEREERKRWLHGGNNVSRSPS